MQSFNGLYGLFFCREGTEIHNACMILYIEFREEQIYENSNHRNRNAGQQIRCYDRFRKSLRNGTGGYDPLP